MRSYSTVRSVYDNEISALAILETLAAMVGTVWLAIEFDNWLHISLSAIFVPLMLLRTERSITFGLQWWNHPLIRIAENLAKFINLLTWLPVFPVFFILDNLGVVGKDDNKSNWDDYNWFIRVCMTPFVIVFVIYHIVVESLYDNLNFILVGCAAIVAKVFATSVCLLRHPMEALRSIPTNWSRLILCTDLLFPPEPVPGLERGGQSFPNAQKYSFATLLAEANADPRERALGVRLLKFIALCLPTLIYRLSLKSTAIIWLPLLWIAYNTTIEMPLKTRLKLVTSDSFARLMLWFSVFVLILFFLKLGLYFSLAEIVKIWASLPFSIGVEFYVERHTLPWWQLAGATNAMSAIILYLFASRQLLLIEESEKQEETMSWVDSVIRTAGFFRGMLSIYTIGCTLYIFFRESSKWNLPRLGDKFFPWQ